jgi:hypothetical protein
MLLSQGYWLSASKSSEQRLRIAFRNQSVIGVSGGDESVSELRRKKLGRPPDGPTGEARDLRFTSLHYVLSTPSGAACAIRRTPD